MAKFLLILATVAVICIALIGSDKMIGPFPLWFCIAAIVPLALLVLASRGEV